MNDKLQERLIEFLDKALNGIDESVSFMSAQLPDYIEQLLTWYLTKGLLTGFLFLAVGLIILKWLFSKLNNKESFCFDSCGLSVEGSLTVIFCGGMGLFMAFGGVFDLMSSLQILIAPKVWLVEYASKLAG
jgi:hypothetical protein